MTYKPVILLGNGCRNNPAFVQWAIGRGVPVLATWQGIDLVPEAAPTFCGRPGIFGQRAANIIQQKATHLYCYGARLDGEQVAYDYDRFAPGAEIFVYDVDRAELDKLPARYRKVQIDLRHESPHVCDANPDWLAWCKALYNRFRPELESGAMFEFIKAVSDAAKPDDLLAIGSSSGAVNSFLQAFQVKAGQRITVCATIGAMGADIPMAIGGCLAAGGGRRTICITGDGGFQLNAQELEVVRRLNLPITFFVIVNNGYNSIRVMQNARYNGRLVGCNPESGFTLPDVKTLAHGYGLPAVTYSPDCMDYYLQYPPMVVEVPIDPEWVQLPRVMASTVNGALRTDDMQDMTPHLDPDELRVLMEWGC